MVIPIGFNVAVLVQQVFAGYLHLIKPDFSIVYPIKSQFMAVILYMDSGHGIMVAIPQRNKDGMYPLVFAIYDQLGKNSGHNAVQGIADIFLIVVFPRCMKSDTIVFRAIGCSGLDSPYIGSVSGLRHGKATGQFSGSYVV